MSPGQQAYAYASPDSKSRRVTGVESNPTLEFLAVLGDGCRELRVLEADVDRHDRVIPAERFKKTFAFASEDSEALGREARRPLGASVYITVNPVNPALAARATRLSVTRATANDGDVLFLRFLFLDFDVKRPSGISSTDEELQNARDRVDQFLADHSDLEPSTVFGCSGNGYWLLVRLPDYPNDAYHRDVIARVTDWAKEHYSDDRVAVDGATKNPARIMPLVGTMKCKGVDTPERPHRMVTMETPPGKHLVPFDLITFANDYCPEVETAPPNPGEDPGVSATTFRTKAKGGTSVYDRAVAYARKIDPAISGENGHCQTLYAACQLLRMFGDNGSNGGLSVAEILQILRDEINPRCLPPWEDKDLVRKASEADKKVPLSERGQKLKETPAQPRRGKSGRQQQPGDETVQDGGQLKYVEIDGKIHGPIGNKSDDYGVLANFTARVTENITRHEGLGTSTRFKIAVRHHTGRTSEVFVPSDKFTSMAWVLAVGAEHVVMPGQGVKDSLRCGIQELSEAAGIGRVEEHTSLGWHKAGSEWIYLNANGAIGANGTSDLVRVDLGYPCNQYGLPSPTNDPGVRNEAIRSRLLIWSLADNGRVGGRSVAAVLETMPVRAVIAACNFTIHFGGPSGNRKTSAARLVAQHHSVTLRGRSFALPAGWRDTENALQRMTFDCRDGSLVIDDLKTDDQLGKAETILQAQGNLQNRTRMNVDQSLQQSLPPRGAILSTGEIDPRTLSTLGRTLVVQIEAGDVDLDALADLQELGDRGVFAQVTACFIRWLAPRLDQIRDELVGKSATIAKDIGTLPGTHPRHIEIVAQLIAGYAIFLRFAVEAEAISEGQAEEYLATARNALIELGQAQAGHQEDAKPGRKFLDFIIGSLASLHCHLANAKNDFSPQEYAGACGWHKDWLYQGGTAGQTLDWAIPANSRRIGFIDEAEGFVYLDPGPSKQIACEAARKSRDDRQSFDSIGRELINEKLVVWEDGKGGDREKRQAAVQKRIPNHGKGRYYKIPIAYLFGEEEDPEGGKNGHSVPTVPTLFHPESEGRDGTAAF